jgi:hypothetical protein
MILTTFEQANKLRAAINDLKGHKEKVIARKNNSNQNGKDFEHSDICFRWANNTPLMLEDKFLIVPMEKLIELYIGAVDKQINDLEAEFSRL